jgi:hypothetical protein
VIDSLVLARRDARLLRGTQSFLEARVVTGPIALWRRCGFDQPGGDSQSVAEFAKLFATLGTRAQVLRQDHARIDSVEKKFG